MAWILVTPSSRGIGFALTQHLIQTVPATVPIVATARRDLPGTKDKLLAALDATDTHAARLDVQECDVLSEDSVSRLASYCKDRYNDRARDRDAHLRLALLLPGMLVPERAPDKIDMATALQTLKLNLLAPMTLVKHLARFLPRKSSQLPSVEGLPARAIMALMSARVGSIADNRLGGWYSYRASKAGVNQLARSTDIHLRMQSGPNAMCVSLHPGTVKTALSEAFWESTPAERLFSPEYSAERLLAVLQDLDEASRGRCWDWQGKEIPP